MTKRQITLTVRFNKPRIIDVIRLRWRNGRISLMQDSNIGLCLDRLDLPNRCEPGLYLGKRRKDENPITRNIISSLVKLKALV